MFSTHYPFGQINDGLNIAHFLILSSSLPSLHYSIFSTHEPSIEHLNFKFGEISSQLIKGKQYEASVTQFPSPHGT